MLFLNYNKKKTNKQNEQTKKQTKSMHMHIFIRIDFFWINYKTNGKKNRIYSGNHMLL